MSLRTIGTSPLKNNFLLNAVELNKRSRIKKLPYDLQKEIKKCFVVEENDNFYIVNMSDVQCTCFDFLTHRRCEHLRKKSFQGHFVPAGLLPEISEKLVDGY